MRISSLSSGKYLDVALEDNRHVQIWERGGENQLWKIEVVEKKKEDLAALKKKDPSSIKKPEPTAIKPASQTPSKKRSRKK